MKKWRALFFVLAPMMTLALYVGGFFVFTEFIPDPHPMLDELHRRKFPSRMLMSFWRPMILYDRHFHRVTIWIDQSEAPH